VVAVGKLIPFKRPEPTAEQVADRLAENARALARIEAFTARRGTRTRINALRGRW